MSNHVHLVVETPQANISRFMQSLMTAYTMYYNKKHNRSGHLLQGRFGGKPVEGDEYLLKLTRYVHLNPVHTGEMGKRNLEEKREYLRSYRWSSFRAYIGLTKEIEGLETGPVLAQMVGVKPKKQRAYRQFVETGLAGTDEEFHALIKGSSEGIGSAEFQEKIQVAAEAKLHALRRPEDARFRLAVSPRKPEEILVAVANAMTVTIEEIRSRQRGNMARCIAAKMLSRHGGLSTREIAKELGLKWGSAVSWQIRKADNGMRKDRKVQRQVQTLERSLRPS